jgi:integrase
MAIRSYVKNGKMLYEAYINGFNSRCTRVQRKRKGIETRRKAEQIEFDLKRELARLKEQSVHLYWDEWLEECLNLMKVSYRPSTVYSYETTVRKWLRQIWRGRELREITKSDVHELIFETISRESATMHTRKYVLKIVKRIFQMAMDHGKLDRNPCNGMMVKVPETEKKVLTNNEVEIFLREAKVTSRRFYPVWTVALFTGMRSGELYALKWSDVDLESRAISVSRSWSSKNGTTSTKNQKSRIVPISEELLAFLKELKLERGAEDFVLPHLTEWTRGDAAKVIKVFCRSLRIAEIRFHDLRATFITNLLSRGESLARVMAIVGHADMETTNVYLRKAGIELKDGTEKLGYKIPSIESAKVLNLVLNIPAN